MNIEEIVEKYLKENKFDGLFNPDIECACSFEDFMPCGEPQRNCEAGIQVAAPPESEYDFIIVPKVIEGL